MFSISTVTWSPGRSQRGEGSRNAASAYGAKLQPNRLEAPPRQRRCQMTAAQEARLRELYRRNFLGLILLPPEVIARELAETERNTTQGREKPTESNEPDE